MRCCSGKVSQDAVQVKQEVMHDRVRQNADEGVLLIKYD